MIKYALRCGDGHAFDSWFQSADAYDTLASRAMIACPECGSTEVGKALMTPKVRDSKAASLPVPKAAAPAPTDTSPDEAREKAIAELRKKVEENSEYVGLEFASEARAIRAGDAPERSIWGEARIGDARKLIEDGVPVAPLPFAPRRKMN